MTLPTVASSPAHLGATTPVVPPADTPENSSKQRGVSSNSSEALGEEFRRIDAQHSADENNSGESTESQAHDAQAAKPLGAELHNREAWLKFHASDLILRLQDWATDLDVREANLNAAYARQDLRERQFRLYQQDVEAQIAKHQRAARALREQISAHSRRLKLHQN